MNCEENYIFTNDPAMLEMPKIDNKDVSKAGSAMVYELRVRLDNYFNIIIRNLRDTVPKILGQFLVNRFSEELEVEILNSLNQKNYCLEVLNESKQNMSTRQKLRNELTALQKAESLLVNEFGMGFSIKPSSHQKTYSEAKELNDEDLLNEIESMNQEFMKFANSLSSHEDKKSKTPSAPAVTTKVEPLAEPPKTIPVNIPDTQRTSIQTNTYQNRQSMLPTMNEPAHPRPTEQAQTKP